MVLLLEDDGELGAHQVPQASVAVIVQLQVECNHAVNANQAHGHLVIQISNIYHHLGPVALKGLVVDYNILTYDVSILLNRMKLTIII